MGFILSRCLPALGLIAIAALSAFASGCSINNSTLQRSYQHTHGDGADKAPSAKVSVSAQINKLPSGLHVRLSCYGSTLSEAALFFTDGVVEKRALGLVGSGEIYSKKSNLWYVRARLASGDYWYFDRSGSHWFLDRTGSWKPASVAATSRSVSKLLSSGKELADNSTSTVLQVGLDGQIAVTKVGGLIKFVSTIEMSSLDAMFRQGDTQIHAVNSFVGSVDLGPRALDLTYFVLRAADGSKWYFDREGLPLPDGYKPTITVRPRGVNVTLESSDAFDRVVIYFADRTYQIHNIEAQVATFKWLPGKLAVGYGVRLKSDGSKWYFDGAGLPISPDSKWFADVD